MDGYTTEEHKLRDETRKIYQQLGDRYSAQLAAGERQELETLSLQREYQTSSLSFSEAPPDTQVFVDGKKLGSLPLERPIRVNPGTRRVELFKPGFEPLEKSVQAVPGGSIVSCRA